MAGKLLEITRRHHAYLGTDPSLGLDLRRGRVERIRGFYTTLFRNLGMNAAEQEAYNLFSSRETGPIKCANQSYQLEQVIETLGVRDNVQIFGILERSNAVIKRANSTEGVEFSVPSDDVQKIVTYLKATGVFQDGRLRKRK